ncbi:MAG TPA: diviva domain-containing protein, partial [Rugosimonospora sp.]|nr:diviva domain-containing protein [Rugosimonospora sp.]
PPVPPGPGYGGGYVADPRFDDLRGDGVGYNDPTRDAPYDDQQRRFEEPPGRPPVPPRYEEPRYDEPRYDDVPRAGGGYPGFEPGRHGKTDMTTEIRMPADISAPVAPALGGDAGRVDQLRRTFQPRRFGSGYDPAQVDRLFEGIVNAMAGRTGGQITDADLDPGQFNLVPGGYFEAEVDQALREVRDLIRNRR